MQETSSIYKRLLEDPGHWKEYSLVIGDHDDHGVLVDEFFNRITFGGIAIIVSEANADSGFRESSLIGISTQKSVFSGFTPTIGNCVAGQITVDMINPNVEIKPKTKIVPYIRLTNGKEHSEWIKKGTFFIDHHEHSGDENERMTVYGYDHIILTEGDYPSSTNTWPRNDIDVVRDIASEIGIELDNRTIQIINKGYKINYPFGYSMREVLESIAVMYGGNFIMSDDEKLLLVQIGNIPTQESGNFLDIGRKMRNFASAAIIDGYDGVELLVDDDNAYYAGSTTGRTLTVECPWGTQDIANNLLNQFRSFKYKPYKAEDAIIDPASEIGDGIRVNGFYSCIYSMALTFTSVFIGTVSAPWEEELDNESPYIPKKDRKIRRQLHGLTTELTVQAGLIQGEITDRINEIDVLESQITQTATEISAKVSKTGGDPSSFEWNLTDSSWKLKSKGSTVLSATASGVEITGKITATSGEIGGFTIEDGYLSTEDQTWGGGSYYGIYIGPYGIQLGTDFSVSRTGHLEAASGKFTGEVYAGSISYDGEAGFFQGYGLEQYTVTGWGGTDQIDSATLNTYNFMEAVNESLANADWAHGVFTGAEECETLSSLTVYTNDLVVSDYMTFGGYQLYLGSFPDKNGNIQRCVQWYD